MLCWLLPFYAIGAVALSAFATISFASSIYDGYHEHHERK